MIDYTLIEGCCGSAAFSYHLSGIKKPLMTYQGSKWRYRKQLEKIISNRGYTGIPSRIELYDPGPWSKVIPILKESKKEILDILNDYVKSDPKIIYQQLQGKFISTNNIQFVADFLFLQRLSFSGKAVGCKKGIWESPGFNSACAYGIKGTDKFGEVKPMIPSLIRTLESLPLNTMPEIISGQYLSLPSGNVENTVLYLDPPYQSSTKYPDGDLSRADLINLAKAWFEAGALVLISEAEPIKELNWEEVCISESRKIESSFKSKKEEWITISI